MGKVVFDLSFDRTFAYWAGASGKDVNEIRNKFFFDSTSDKFERDEISPENFRRVISQQLELTLSDEEFDAGWCALYKDPYKGIEELLKSLKQHYQIAALTNTNLIHQPVWKAKYAGILKHFEMVFSSPELKTRKPEKEAYQIVLDHFKVQPSQTLFLDDNPQNITGAKTLGIATILVNSPEQMFSDLRMLGLSDFEQ